MNDKILETDRLTLEKAITEDSKFFFELLNSPNWIEFIGDRGIKTNNQAIEYIESLINSYKNNGYGLYKVSLKNTQTPIGICGFVKRDYLENADIGFAILPKYEGKGYTEEAAKAVMKYGESKLKLSPIYAVTTQENHKSRNLLNKIGLLEIGKIKPNGSNTEFLLFSN
ncbi:GNAT family N-acetyltransferase [Aquimarina celericrescens]|uniref:GNAT family N-acetyltransferase n=1 Tax=Aquimarina celericrescens TaxID=1964542 RepID=A0ABW5B432_9FLAO|nr:GNAT family N-acetyltransferase [Aquimarina celericrescens]